MTWRFDEPVPVPKFKVSPACTSSAPMASECAFGEIADVDVVTHARPVRRRVVVAVDLQLIAEAERSVEGDWDQVDLRVVSFRAAPTSRPRR